MAVTVVHFNPQRRSRPGLLGMLTKRVPLNNFGDLAGPRIVARIVQDLGLVEPSTSKRLASVGSIMKLTQPGDTVWGTGINGKSMGLGGSPGLDVRAVRGPLTRELLLQSGARVPAVYGDPALLWARFWPKKSYTSAPSGQRDRITIVPNFHDYSKYASDPRVVNPCDDIETVITRIANSDFVCGSSLHGIVFAESFGIPARLVISEEEHPFKYNDYFAGTGRPTYGVARSPEEAMDMGGERPIDIDLDALLEAFPADLWSRP